MDLPNVKPELTELEAELNKTGKPLHNNYGNVVFSCYNKVNEPKDKTTYNLNAKKQPIMYRTSANAYGEMPMTPDTCALTHNIVDSKFTCHLLTCGMYRNHSLNVELDRTRTIDRTTIS